MQENSVVLKVKQGHDFLVKILDYLRDPFLLIIRLYWGYSFYLAGRGKLLNLERTTEFFSSINIPAPKLNAIIAGTTECFGGWLLLLGLASRLISLPLAFTMIVAYLTAHKEALTVIFSDPSEFLKQDPFLFLYASLLIMTCGPGRLSLDSLIRWKLFSEEKSENKK